MSIPVISTSSSVIDFPLGDPWVFQPSATNSPTSWTWTNLPPGITADSSTGAIGGVVNTKGIWVATVKATNSSGDSLVMEMPISIHDGAWNNPASIEMKIDATTGAILTSTNLNLKTDSDYILAVAFYDASNNLLTLSPSSVSVVLKSADSGSPLVETDGTFSPRGDVTTRHYEVLIPLRGNDLASQLALDARSSAPSFSGYAEVRFQYAVTFRGSSTTLKKVSASIPVTVTRNLLAT